MNQNSLGSVINVLPTDQRASSSVSSAVDVSAYEGNAIIVLDSALADAGTNPTLDAKITHCDTSDGTYTDISGAAFAQVTDAADSTQKIIVNLDSVKKYIKADYTIGGTDTPKFSFSVNLFALKKYNG
ncbi:MAG: hypothetical protein QY317_16185 [Candidatus Jettenia caeni]|nr:MAG: hypothetical protein QY317_16185 [Candidatus Jettenia caeni]